MGGDGYATSGEVPWNYADGDADYIDPAQLESGGPAWDLWQGLFGSYLDTRNAVASAAGETFPETTAGDVRKASLALSRELCLPRYDFADLTATRTAWREALARINTLCACVPWAAPYPENERFWLSDSLALAQRLAAVDARRNAVLESADGVPTIIGDRSDPLVTWQDLRAFYMTRRLVLKGKGGWTYPETTVRDARAIVRILNRDLNDIVALLPATSPELAWLRPRLKQWRPIADAVKAFARTVDPGSPLDPPYPENAALWPAAKRIAIALSVARSGAREPSYGDLFVQRLDEVTS